MFFYSVLIILLVLMLILSLLGQRKTEQRDELRSKLKEDLYRTEITKHIDSASGQVEVIVVQVLDKNIQKECQDVVSKMYKNNYKLISTVPIINSHREGDAGMAQTLSIVHYFEKILVVNEMTEDCR